MGLLRWLFGARSSRTHLPPTDNQWTAQSNASPPSQQIRSQWQATQPAARFIPASALMPPQGVILIDYTNANDQRRTRHIRPLLAAPGNMLTAIDIGANRIRTYRLDRIHSTSRQLDGDAIDIRAYLLEMNQIEPSDFLDDDTDRSAALDMLRRMLCQICIVRLVAEADGPATDSETATLLKYIKRDNRFAVRSDFVDSGDKRGVWPIALDAALAIPIRATDLTALLATMFSDWENPRRFAALGDALTEMANLTPSIHPKVRSMIATINGFRQ